LAGWGLWTDPNNYSQLGFYRQSNGMVLISGLMTYLGGTGATNVMTGVSGNYRPREAPTTRYPAHILNGSVNDTPRTFDLTSTGLALRGAAPAVNQWVSVNGVYPSILVRV
jgi:hypothetical protein